jgi:micrococcal nuclease
MTLRTIILAALLLAACATAETAVSQQPQAEPSLTATDRRATEVLAGPFNAEILTVYDGDTVTARVRIWISQTVVTSVRIQGIDAPEMGQGAKCEEERALAVRSRDRLQALIYSGTVTLTEVWRDPVYGRRVIAVLRVDGADVAPKLIAEGLARPYGGGRRQGWCG